MGNNTAPADWAPSSLAPAIPAHHGSTCVCRTCRAENYASLLETSDYQHHEITRLTAEVSRLKFALAVEKYRRLTLVIQAAIAAGDQGAWQKACAERMELGVAVMERAETEAA